MTIYSTVGVTPLVAADAVGNPLGIGFTTRFNIYVRSSDAAVVRPTFAGAFTGATVLLAAVACGPVNSANFLSRFYLSVRASDASITRLAINLPGARRTFGTNQQFRWG